MPDPANEIQRAAVKSRAVTSALRADQSLGQHEAHVQQGRGEIIADSPKIRQLQICGLQGIAGEHSCDIEPTPGLCCFQYGLLAVEDLLAQHERTRPVPQVLPDGVDGEMEEGGKEPGRYPFSDRCFEFTRKAIAFLVMVTPAAVEQRFERTGFVTAGHFRLSRKITELEVRIPG